MGNKKLSELSQISTIATGDQMLVSDISEASGSKSKYVTFTQLDARYAVFDPTQIPYGDMFVASNGNSIGIVAQSTYVQMDDYAEGETNLVTYATSQLTITTDSIYDLSVNITARKAATAGVETYQFTVFVNGVASTKLTASRDFDNAETGFLAISGLISLSQNDVLDLRVQNVDATDDIIIVSSNFKIIGV